MRVPVSHSVRCCIVALLGVVCSTAFGQPTSGAGDLAVQARISGPVRLTMPSVIYATPGIECNVYFDNIVLVLNRHNYAFDVGCEKGFTLAERWAFTPADEECGDFPIAIEVRDEANKLLARGESLIRVGRPMSTPAAPVTLLVLGASFVEYSIYPQHILELSKAESALPLRLLGSRGAGNMPATGDLRHEGYSGWTAEAFATLSGPVSRTGYHHRPGTGSPFVYQSEDGTKALDFGRYLDEFNDGKAPDFVTIDLGGNDIFSATDATIDATIDRMFTHYDAVIDSIRKAGPQTRIGVLASTPPSSSQDGFRNYVGTGKQTQWQFHRNIHRLVERKLEHYDHRTSEGIYFVPTFANLDTEAHFPTWTSPRNARSDQEFVRVNNGTHPSVAGYEQIGDTVFSWLMNCVPGSDKLAQ
jgi:lysophospholipase L1-like esterase